MNTAVRTRNSHVDHESASNRQIRLEIGKERRGEDREGRGCVRSN
jgi:hypothetical protein